MGKRISIKRGLWRAYGVLLAAMAVILFVWGGLIYMDYGYMEDVFYECGNMFTLFVSIAVITPVVGAIVYKLIR